MEEPDYVEVKDGICERDFTSEVFPSRGYEWDDFQKFAFHAIDEGNNVLVCAPTASGKTTVAEYAIVKHLSMGNRVIFTSPIKSLSLEKLSEFKELCAPLDIMPGILTGDNKENLDSPLIIATAEIIRNSLYRLKEELNNPNNVLDSDLINNVSCVVIDEAHYINDTSRGSVWEETLTLLDSKVQVVMLSATIDSPEKFAAWLGKIKKRKITVVKKYIRPVPLSYYLFDGTDSHMICDADGKYMEDNYRVAETNYDVIVKNTPKNLTTKLLNRAIKYAKDNDLLQMIIFVFSIAKCEQFSDSITVDLLSHSERSASQQEFIKRMKPLESEYKNLPLYNNIKRLVGKGICYHHSDLPPIFKEILQEMFRDGFLKVIFATETFAVGVNMPVRTIMLTSLEKYSDNGHRLLRPDEFKQICGRAGRRGKDTFGRAIMLPLYDIIPSKEMRGLIFGKMPTVRSKMEMDYNMFLKLKQSKIADDSSFFSHTLKQSQNMESVGKLHGKIEELQRQLDEIPTLDETSSDAKMLKEYVKLKEISSGKATFGGLVRKMAKKDKKRLKQLERFVSDNKILYKNYNDRHNINVQIDDIDYEIEMLTGGLSKRRTEQLTSFLQELGYLNAEGELTPNGVLASQVNECDASPLLIYTFNKILEDDDLTAQEIVAIISILLDKTRSERSRGMTLGEHMTSSDRTALKYTGEYYDRDTVDCTKNIRKIVKDIQQFTEDARRLESRLGIYTGKDCWRTSLGSIELSYSWANGEDIGTMCETLYDRREGLGTFIRNMLKINNIISDLKCIATGMNRLEIVEVLDVASESIVRGVVNNFSLHLLE